MTNDRIGILVAGLLIPLPGFGDAQLEAGRKVFMEQAQPSCAVCHTLSDAGATGVVGPNLDELAPSVEQVQRAVTSGVGIMPPFGESLSEDQIAAVAHYVSTVTAAK
ncbi:SorU family sulfite dehydrogenase c-type cytochrome subunit [Marinobacter mobilis]|uniref:Cytochrome C oxidase, cbb3-type, subunit III n=1 Tax=Marinobacter mobilis TaxID=488533 RepID=A0A1H3AW26_9GAMM|nr:cytochrome c [Marinobacter mobilis]SDX33314.1 Cytochrome C oxidase, cbb3-type, subunit III [Marinobacter mobilis]